MIHVEADRFGLIAERAHRRFKVYLSDDECFADAAPRIGTPYRKDSPYLLSRWTAHQIGLNVFEVDATYTKPEPQPAGCMI